MLDHLSLICIFYHFIFCDRTCQLNASFCGFCSRVTYENSDYNKKRRRTFKDVKLIDVCNSDITTLLYNSK